MPTYLHSVCGCFCMMIQSSLKTLGAEPALGHLFCSDPSLLTCWLCLWIGVQHPCMPFQKGILVKIHRKCFIYLVICPALNTHLLHSGLCVSFEYFPRDHKGKRSQDKGPINYHTYLFSMLVLHPRLRISTIPLSYMPSSLLLCLWVSLCAPNRSKLPRQTAQVVSESWLNCVCLPRDRITGMQHYAQLRDHQFACVYVCAYMCLYINSVVLDVVLQTLSTLFGEWFLIGLKLTM